MLPVRKKDKVVIIAGKDKGKRGEVLKTFAELKKVIVSKINVVKKTTRPTQTDRGGIKEIELPISLANVMLICPKCDQPTRVKFDFLSDGKKVRICKKCGEMVI